MDEFELELKQDFLEESTDLLEAAEDAFLNLEKQRNDSELLNEIFRLAHNLKGTSKAVGFDQLSQITHTAENLILKLKENEIETSDEVVTTLLEFKDLINLMVNGLKEDLDATFEVDSLANKIEKLLSGDNSLKETALSPAIIESLQENGINVEEVHNENKEEENSEKVEIKFEETKPSEKVELPKEVPKKKNNTNKDDESIRVKLSRIDQINNVLGELVILQTLISQRRYEYIEDELSNKSIGMMNKLFKEAQELTMSLRMLPLKTTFNKMNRIVRDTSIALDKKVELKLMGEETEVDKTILEKLGDPLVHIIRNAVDHGIETPETREANGKERHGTVELMAYHEGNNLVIQITDDGKGIDPEALKEKAISKGIISEKDQLTEHQIIQLIFHPGFSMKEQVTEVSGRGVGMDVVKTNIEILGGEVKLMSKLGQGSSFKIMLPLTLAIIDGLVIKEEMDKFVIPLSQVNEIIQVPDSEIERYTGFAEFFNLRGEVLPLFYLCHKLGVTKKEKEKYTVVVVRSGGSVYGVVIDDILFQQQIVIKKLGQDVCHKVGLMGSSIMSDGMPALIIDLFELFKKDIVTTKKMRKNSLQDMAS